jgi:cytoskeletal protein RodZ
MNEKDSVLSLATIRRNRGVSLEDIAEATKISIRALRAIEVGEFQKLPGGIYNTSYIRQYAKAIDFDAATILDYYHRKMGSSSAQTRPQDGSPRDNDKNKGVFSGVRPSALLGL